MYAFCYLLRILFFFAASSDLVTPSHNFVQKMSTVHHLRLNIVKASDDEAPSLSSFPNSSIFRVHIFSNIDGDTLHLGLRSIDEDSLKQIGFDFVHLDLPGGGSFTLEKSLDIDKHWTGRSTVSGDTSELYLKYDSKLYQILVTVNCANGDTYKVNTRADGSTWATLMKYEVSFVNTHGTFCFVSLLFLIYHW